MWFWSAEGSRRYNISDNIYKTNIMKRIFAIIAAILSVSLFTMCDKGPDTPALQELQLDRASLGMVVGDVDTVYVSTVPAGAEVLEIACSSDNEDVARVAAVSDSSFRVEAVGVGEAKITFSSEGIKAECAVNVQERTVPVESVGIEPETLELFVGDTGTLTALVLPLDADYVLEWTSSDAGVASVDAEGNVEALSAGTCVIKATAGGISDSVNVIVEGVSIILSEETYSMGIGNMGWVTAEITPEEYAGGIVEWSVDSPDVVELIVYDDEPNSAYFSALSQGTAVLTATYKGASAECVITVGKIPVTEIIVTNSGGMVIDELTLGENGNRAVISAFVMPGDATDQAISYEIGDTGVATIEQYQDEYGRYFCDVTPWNEGSTVLYISAGDFTLEFPVNVVSAQGNNPYGLYNLYDREGLRGIVWWISDDRSSLKIISMDNGENLAWATAPVSAGVPEMDSHTEGDANTDIILGNPGDFPAAEWCRGLGDGWYLPSAAEIRNIYVTLRLDLEAARTSNGGSAFPATAWTSNENETGDPDTALAMFEEFTQFWNCAEKPKTEKCGVIAAKIVYFD